MSVAGENIAVLVGGSGLAGETREVVRTEKVRVSRRDRRLIRAAVGIMAVLAVVDAVLYLGRFV